MENRTNKHQNRQYPLLPTKLYIPPLRSDFVQRPHLIDRMNQAVNCKLTLVCAPAGFGKTTLISEWISKNDAPTAWISLDKGDNDPVQFIHYLVAALRGIDVNIDETAKSILEILPQSPLESAAKNLVYAFNDISHNAMLVLDDYHTIDIREIHHIVETLVEYLPQHIRLVIATRVDPPLPLARLRVRNQLVELRAADLSFTHKEVTEFFNHVMDLRLSTDEIGIFEHRTEGWIAGLQLAALSMQAQHNIHEFIKSFAGDDRFIVDYLVEEVLNQQPKRVQDFLLQTSILNMLSEPLCDYVIEHKESQKLLEELERANLFIVPLDSKRQWYRYHHLFADLLQTRLLQYQPDIVSTLHMRASVWFEQNGSTTEAVNHALSAKNYERAALLVEENTLDLLCQGELQSLLRWIKVLPEKAARHRPWLCIYQAWALAFAGQLAEVLPLLKKAERIMPSSEALGDKNVEEVDKQEMVGNIAAMRAYLAVMTGDFTRAIEFAKLAGEMLSDRNLWACSVFQWVLGIAHRVHGDLMAAGQACAEVVKLGRAMGNVWTTVTGLTDLAIVHLIRGQLHQATELYREALQLGTERGARNLGYMGRVETGLAYLLYEQNDMAAAQDFLNSSIEKTKKWENPNHFVFSYNLLDGSAFYLIEHR